MTAPTARDERGSNRGRAGSIPDQPGAAPGRRRHAPGQPGPAAARMRPDRIYLGWQHALLHPDPGPQPKRPTPPEQEQLNPDWVAAQRHEENLLDRPLKLVGGVAVLLTGLLLAAWVAGWLNAAIAWLGATVCLAGAGAAARVIWRGEQALRSRVDEEKQRLGKIRAEQESRLFGWQEEHARRFQDWQERRAAFERQPQWYAVSLPARVDRVDLAGGTLPGWSAMFTVVGASRLAAGGELTVIDLSEGAVAGDLLAVAARSGIDPLVWVLPADLPRLDLSAGLSGEALADVLALVVSVSEDEGAGGDMAQDNAILERLLDVFGAGVTIAQATAALRALGQIGDPREDIRRGLLSPDQLERITAMFGRGAADRVVIGRAWAMESRLRKLDRAGLAPPDELAPSRLRVICTDRRAGVFGNRVLGSYTVTALTHVLRQSRAGRPWQHTLMLAGADRLRGDVIDRLCDACEATRTGLLLAYRSIPAHVKERLGRGNAALAFMRLGNSGDARVASEQIGTEHRFVLTQLTDTVGTSLTDTVGDSYTSTVGTADSVSASATTSQTAGRSSGRGRSHESIAAPFGPATSSRSGDRSYSSGTSDAESITEGINLSTAWGISTSRAVGANDSLARTVQRSREFLVEQHELQQLPPSAVIISSASRGGRRIVMADANPGILGLPAATLLSLDEARNTPGGPADSRPREPAMPPPAPAAPERGPAPVPVSWRSGDARPPPNLGPPPERLDWRKRRD